MAQGLVVCFVCALVASWIATLQHYISAPLMGLFLGIILANTMPQAFLKASQKGAAFSAKRILRIGIILAGATLNFSSIVKVGASALPLIVGSMVIAFIAAWIFGKFMNVASNTRLLVGGGTSICGGTAVATLSAVIEAKEDETAYAMTAIFLWDILACLIWPYVAVALNYTPTQYGLLGGIAINDVSSVTAAAQTYNTLMGEKAYADGISGGDLAMIVKLTRVALLVVVALIMTVVHQRSVSKSSSSAQGGNASIAKTIIGAFPFYVLGFLLLAIVNTIIDFSSIKIGATSASKLLSTAYKFLFSMALVGVGYKIKIKELFTKGMKPVVLGGLTWATVAVITLAYNALF